MFGRPELKLGVKVEDDLEYTNIPDSPSKYLPVKADFSADRVKSNLQKGMDQIFGFAPAAKRQPSTTDKKNELAKTVSKKESTLQASQAQKALDEKKAREEKKLQDDKKAFEKKSTSKTETIKAQPIKETTSVIVGFGQQMFNRPIYVRKLKKIAENFEFATINSKNHTYYDVLRPFECDKSRIAPLQKSNSEGGSFSDKQFPATSINVGRSYNKQQVSWKRAGEFCNRTVFGRYVEPNDFQPGKLSCQSFLSVLSCLAERQRNVKRIIQNQQYNANGCYYVRLNINGVWRYMVVDDFLPLIDGQNAGVLSYKDNQSQISISIIEKAYAKAYNGYNVFSRGCKPEDYLRDLTGSTVTRYALDDRNLSDVIKESVEQSWTVLAVPNTKIEQFGLSSKLNLGVIGFGSRGLELRNSWGTFVEKSKINFSKEGLFEMTVQEASKYFEYILVAETNDSYHTSTIQSKHHSGFYSSYSFKNKESGEIIFSASQWDTRLYPAQWKGTYSPLRLVVEKRKSEAVSQYVGGVFTKTKRNTDLVCSVTPGEYTVHCIGSWKKGQAPDYTLTIFGNQVIKFLRNKTQSFPNLICRALQKLNLDDGKRAAKGYVQQYILYHEPTNLMLLTNLNVSGKPYDYTQDLSKITFNTLSLLNGSNSDTNYGARLYSEITEEKENYNTDRRWNIHLEAKEAFTWVIGTTEDYNSNNFKNWGFK